MNVLDLLSNPARARLLIARARSTDSRICRRYWAEEYLKLVAELPKDKQRDARRLFPRVVIHR